MDCSVMSEILDLDGAGIRPGLLCNCHSAPVRDAHSAGLSHARFKSCIFFGVLFLIHPDLDMKIT